MKHDVLIAAYWAAGLIALVLGALWVIWSATRAQVNGKRIAGHRALSDLSRDDADPHWASVKNALPGSAGEMRPEDDPCICENPGNPQREEGAR